MLPAEETGPGAGGDQSLRLNGLPPEGPTAPGLAGPGDLVSTPAAKRAAAGTIESELEPATKKAGDRADDANAKVVSGLDGWAAAAGMKTVQETWDRQVAVLLGRLAGEKGALRAAAGALQGADGERKARIGAVRSNFDTY